MFSSLLDRLNPQQREAVENVDGPMLVVAGAGSGKTRVITHRIAYLLSERGVPPFQILAATFTNKAAEEMRARIARLAPGADAARLTIATFHAICVGILRREAHVLGLSSRFTIADDTDQKALIKECLRNLDVVSAIKPEEVRGFITAAKIRMLEPAQARRELPGDHAGICARVYEQYQERLLTGDAVDFDDLLLHVVRIFQQHPDILERYRERWRYLLIDEYQDTNRVQFEFVKLLAGGSNNVCVVGDEDQSIYSWRGAEIENLLQFPELFPGTQIVRLEQNYRSTETILDAADAVIANNTQRMGKTLWSERGRGEPITMVNAFNEREEAAIVVDTIRDLKRFQGRAYNDMAIFYRVNALSRVFEDQLRQAGVAYRVIGGIKFYDRAEVKDLLAYLRVCVNPRDSIGLARIVNKPARGIGQKSLANIYNEAVRRGVSLWDVLQQIAERHKDAPSVSGKARTGITDFCLRVKEWAEWGDGRPPADLLEKILRETQYEEALGNDKDLEVITRRENIGELVSALEEFHKNDPGGTLDDFLERVALVNAQDEAMADEDAVSLMTLHSAKGLEFPVVFMVGLEDPLFPSQRAVNECGHYEEERRLFYVGITRAEDLLFLTRADSRVLHGRPQYNTPSLFLREVPGELLRHLEDARRAWREAATDAPPMAAPAMREAVAPPRSAPQPQRSEPFGFRGSSRLEEPSVADEGGRFPVGSRVVHERLGEGEVILASGGGDKRKVTVRFDAGIQLEILEQYGGLTPADADNDMPF